MNQQVDTPNLMPAPPVDDASAAVAIDRASPMRAGRGDDGVMSEPQSLASAEQQVALAEREQAQDWAIKAAAMLQRWPRLTLPELLATEGREGYVTRLLQARYALPPAEARRLLRTHRATQPA
jgi:hypothetical protein